MVRTIVELLGRAVRRRHAAAASGVEPRALRLGFLLAAAVGVPLGLLMGWFRWLDDIVRRLFEALRFIAPIAWVPFAALWFGTGIGGPTLIIFSGAFPPASSTPIAAPSTSSRATSRRRRRWARAACASIAEVLLPASLPSIVAGLRISAGLGWQSLVGAELIVASSGVGYMMVKGQAATRTPTVMAGMIAIGIVGVADRRRAAPHRRPDIAKHGGRWSHEPHRSSTTCSRCFERDGKNLPRAGRHRPHGREKEFVAIVGPSGCGKTTLPAHGRRARVPSAGTVRVAATSVTGPGPDRAVVFQQFALFPWKIGRENIDFGLKCTRRRRVRAEATRRPLHQADGPRGLRERLSRTSSPAACSSAWRSRAPTRSTRRCC